MSGAPGPRRPLPGRILLTNDDGIGAPGLKVLFNIARQLTEDIWICAPNREYSGAGHSLSLHRPLRVQRQGRHRFAVDGTPTDCVLLGLHEIMRGTPPDLVLSGINRGSNVGDEVTYSGTVAAAMEATLLGVPAIALSQQTASGRKSVHWATAERHAPDLIRRLWRMGWPRDVLVNVNFPDVVASGVRGTMAAAQGQRRIAENLDRRVDPRGRPYYWIGMLRTTSAAGGGTDIAALADNRIAVTPIHLDMTHQASMNALRQALDGPAE